MREGAAGRELLLRDSLGKQERLQATKEGNQAGPTCFFGLPTPACFRREHESVSIEQLRKNSEPLSFPEAGVGVAQTHGRDARGFLVAEDVKLGLSPS